MSDRHKQKNVSRRQFIVKAAGAAGVIAAASTPFVAAFNRVRAAPERSSDHRTKAHEQGSVEEKKLRAWCMVIDLKKCDGCLTINTPPQCTQACIATHFIPKGQQWIEIFQKESPGGGSFFMPTPCYQCENAPCVNVCPVAATYHDEDGIVLIDHRRCIGCRLCMAACPYQRRFFNWGTAELPPEAASAEYSPLYPVPAVKGTVIKCMFCAHFLEDGRLPACVAGCPMKALYIGDLNEDAASNGAEVVRLAKFLDDNDAYRYKEDLGTQPRVWYLPGHGQEFGRKADDRREMIPAVWSYGSDGYNRQIGIWPWSQTDTWTWEAPQK